MKLRIVKSEKCSTDNHGTTKKRLGSWSGDLKAVYYEMLREPSRMLRGHRFRQWLR